MSKYFICKFTELQLKLIRDALADHEQNIDSLDMPYVYPSIDKEFNASQGLRKKITNALGDQDKYQVI